VPTAQVEHRLRHFRDFLPGTAEAAGTVPLTAGEPGVTDAARIMMSGEWYHASFGINVFWVTGSGVAATVRNRQFRRRGRRPLSRCHSGLMCYVSH
jgi:hypothetical protein